MNLPKLFNFIYPWRNYQKRFLDDFEEYIEDQHLHVVAPPGSGKTVLGLEMIRRVNTKTLVLAPTLTIRNQWNERMHECFLKDKNAITVSFDIKKLECITFSTYQSLHSFYKNDCESDKEKLIAYFKNNKIETIVLDEAHHLKNEWWTPLFTLKDLPHCTIISLTATPPYDSEMREIKRYFDLCGPIDMEIGVPELVREKNLCPHQDFIYFSKPEQSEIEAILAYRKSLMGFVNDLTVNESFITFIKNHPYYANTFNQTASIYSNTAFYSAILIFLNACGVKILKDKIEVLGVSEENPSFPFLSYEWVTHLLQPILIEERAFYAKDEEVLLPIEKKLRKIGALQKNKINFVGDRKLYASLSQSPKKLQSIVEILKVESSNLSDDLRMVVLCDYIRKEFLDFGAIKPTSEIDKLGVAPIFQYIKRKIKEEHIFSIDASKIGVLTGSLIVLHQTHVAALRAKTSENYFTHSYNEDGFVVVNPTTKGKKYMVAAITELFEEGTLTVLIGTKSLLGEGWDAPAINTLVLASFVGSFVMSNQMRGRAIRVNPRNKNKSANIWHLACVDTTVADGGADIKTLFRRFDAFSGVSLKGECYIENGYDRLQIQDSFNSILLINETMRSIALDRNDTKVRWDTAIEKGSLLLRELKLDFKKPVPFQKQKQIYYKDALKYTLIEIFSLVTITLPELLFKNLNVLFSRGLLYFFYAIVSGIIILFLPKMIKAIQLYLTYGRRDKEFIKIATILMQVMSKAGVIKTELSLLKVQVDLDKSGAISCYLLGANSKESVKFIDYLQAIIEPIDNPRYLITQSNLIRKKLGFSNYYSVPGFFGEDKTKAQLFFDQWKLYYQSAQLQYTRNAEGRKVLLKARFQSFQPGEKIKSKKALIWK